MTRLEFINAERDLVLTILGLALIAVLVFQIGEPAVASIILLLAVSMLAIIVLAMTIDDEGRNKLYNSGHHK